MIEVVGKDPKHMKQCSCKNCATVLRYTENEVTTKTSTDYGGGLDTWKSIRCPVCGNKVTVSHT